MKQRTAPSSIAGRPGVLLRMQEQLELVRSDSVERSARLPLLRLAAAVLVALLALGTASGLLAAA